jgi:hypothetical protein
MMSETDTILLAAIQNVQADVRELRQDVSELYAKMSDMSLHGCAKVGDHSALVARVASLESFRSRLLLACAGIGAAGGLGTGGIVALAKAMLGGGQ